MPAKDYQKNITKMYFYRFLRDFWLIVPIMIAFYKLNMLDERQIFTIQAVFSLSLLLFEIPSGYFSDVWGRKITLIMGAATLPLGLLFYAAGGAFWHFLLAEAVLGFGFAMCSGTESAMIYDTLLMDGRQDEYSEIEGKAEFLTRIGTTTAGLLGAVLAFFYILLPFYLNILSSIMMIIIAFSFLEPHRLKLSKNPLRKILKAVRISLAKPGILSLILLYSSVVSSGVLSIWIYLLLFKYFSLPLYINGIWFALFQISSALGALLSSRITKLLGIRYSYLLILLIPFVLIIQGFIKSELFIFVSFVQAFIWGFSVIFFLNLLNIQITSDVRGTVLSTASMVSRLFLVLLAPIIGILIEKSSILSAFPVTGLIFLIIFLIAILIINPHRRSTENNSLS